MEAYTTNRGKEDTAFVYAYLVDNMGENLNLLPNNYIYVTQNVITCAHLIAANIPAIYVHDLQQKLGIIPKVLIYCESMLSMVPLYRGAIPLPEGSEYVVETINNVWSVTYAS